LSFNPSTYTQKALISAPKIPTDFLWALSLFFVLIALVYFGSVFFFRNKLSRRGKHVKVKRKVFSPMICEFLFFEEDGEKKEKINYIDLKIQIRELIRNKFDREVLTEVLMDLRKDVTGKTRTELFHIYQDLELHKDAYQKLNSWRWELISRGIFELTQMEVKDSYSLITRFINDKRTTIRKQAEIATVSLKEEGINYFLDHTKYRISEWQQLKLLDVVRNKTDYQPPAFRLWLTSKNNDVVLFSLRLIKYYNQNDASASLIQLLRHKSNAIKKEAIFCIRDFNVTEAVPILKTIFWKCTTDIKMYLLEALSQLGSEEDIGFLEDIISKEVAFTVKGKAISALNTIRPEGMLPTQDIVPTADFEVPAPSYSAKVTVADESTIPNIKKEKQVKEKEIAKSAKTLARNTADVNDTSRKIEADEISFLPIVTEGITEPISKSIEKNITEGANQKDLTDLSVCFEEVPPLRLVDKLHYEFLPIVMAEPVKQNNVMLNDLPVHFEEIEVGDLLKIAHQRTFEHEINEFVVLFEEVLAPKKALDETDVLEKHSKSESVSSNHKSKISFSDSIATSEISKINVVYDILNEAKGLSSKGGLQEIDWCNAFDLPKLEQSQELSLEINIENDMEKELRTIPKPLFYEDTALNTMALLEDIAELGDHREIPHLKMLLEHETNAVVKIRINELLAFFTITDDLEVSFEPTITEERQSIFHNLIEVSDTEAKIILLDEIAEVGDQQEIALLKNLLLSNEIELRRAAKRALEKIISRQTSADRIEVIQEPGKMPAKEIITSSDAADNPFTVDFEAIRPLETAIKLQDHTKDQTYGNTLFDHLCAISTKLYQKE
jgi:HEAT repeat protein